MKHYIFTLLITLSVTLIPMSGQTKGKKEKQNYQDKVVVTATKTAHSIEDVPVNTVLITSEDIEKSNAKTISGLIAEVPGFNFSQQSDMTGAMGYKNTVRGLNVELRYMLILVDGQRVFTGFHSGGMNSAGFSHNVNVVPVSMIESIEIVKGPGSALYGSDAMVGVMNIITKKPGKKLHVQTGAGYSQYKVAGKNYLFQTPEHKNRESYEAYATLSGPLNDKISGVISINHEENDGILPEKYDVSRNYIHGQIKSNPTAKLELRAGVEYTDWKAEENNLKDKKTESAPRLWAGADYKISPEHKIKLQGYFQKLDADFSDQSYGDQNADVSYRDIEFQYTGSIFQNHLVTLGAEYLEEVLDTNLVDDSFTTYSLYLQDEWTLMNSSLILVPGVRYDDNDFYGNEVNPKLSAMYKPFPGTRIRLSAGWSFKAPIATQTSAEPINHVTMWVLSNPDLEPERAFTWQAGVEQEMFNKRLVFDLTLYHSDIEDLISTAVSDKTIDSLPAVTYKNVNEATIKGLEFSAKIKLLKELNIILTYAYTDAKDSNTDERLINTPEHSLGAKLDYINSKYGFGSNISISHKSDQVNMDYGIGGSLITEELTTVGLKFWKDFMQNGQFSIEASNIFDEELKGSDTIFVNQSVTAKINFNF